MRILQCSPCVARRSGGPAVVVDVTTGMLQSAGHHVTVVATDQLMSDDEVAERCNDYVLFRSFGGSRVAFSPALLFWILRRRTAFDVIHIHGYQQPVSLGTIALCVLIRMPFVLAPHGTLGSFELAKGSRLKRVTTLLLRLFLGTAPSHVILCTTEAERSDLPSWVRSTAVSPIPVEADDSVVVADRNVGEEPQIVLHLGRIAQKKGLVRSARLLADTGMDTRFIIAGDVSGAEAEQIRDEVESIVGRRADFLGHVEGEQKAQLLHRASCLVLLSDDENFAVAVAEALVAGTPVLISERVALSSTVEELGGGVVVAGNGSHADATDLAAAMTHPDPSGLAAAARAHFAPTRIVGDLERCYQRLIDARS